MNILKILKGIQNQLDIVFIDGNHKYQPVLDDIEAWYPQIRPGGLLCGHDYSPDHPEVSRAVKNKVRMLSEQKQILCNNTNILR